MEYFRHIGLDAIERTRHITCFSWIIPLLSFMAPRNAVARINDPFELVQNLTAEQDSRIHSEATDIANWINRGKTIRKSETHRQCLGNLTAAMDLIGDVTAAEYQGASGALSLLPTAGALLGAPTREMWIVYKLVPMAGVFSMLLSIGGCITPSKIGDYDPAAPVSYGGFMPTPAVTAARRQRGSRRPGLHGRYESNDFINNNDEDDDHRKTAAREFAKEVENRAEDECGGGIETGIYFAIALQLLLILGMLVPMWFLQQGAVVVWWCHNWGWMYSWYLLVTFVSIMEAWVAAPFTKSWKIRVSKRPSGILLDESVRKITELGFENALEAIKAGPNINQRPRISADQGSGYPRTCFYVVISVYGVSKVRALLQIFSKGASVAVFAFGTTLFASATLMAQIVATTLLCLLLACGVFGRVIAMWIVSQISRENQPILHRLVTSESVAGEYIDAIAQLDLQLEISGHVILNGYCVKSRSRLLSPATYVGLLAKPFNVIGLAERSFRGGMFSPTQVPLSSPFGTPLTNIGMDNRGYTSLSARSSRHDQGLAHGMPADAMEMAEHGMAREGGFEPLRAQ